MGLEGGRIIIVTLLWSEVLGGCNTPDTIGGDRSVKVGHEIKCHNSVHCAYRVWLSNTLDSLCTPVCLVPL